MLSFLPSKDEKTIAIQFEGKATKEDAENLDNKVEELFRSEEPFNILAILYEVEGSTVKGMMEGIKFDAKRWKQLQKLAVVSDREWVARMTNIGKYLPGIQSKHFEKDELEQAWEWIKE
ncbi:STAS/SEC14 domain-containing protein [Pueribacillus theae]|uniref:STAS/SEC14 domain-containing protein n=1 Tax=Pueribacillus theae TaxID=2171751 RepID=A0A2U1JWU3_9BACI|nr:STAS/SEC14 domain-containing protein [Pueribacillus theae]PWA09686.1 STAS/SEC14 domain-containing protein [Pueribacillus theae]